MRKSLALSWSAFFLGCGLILVIAALTADWRWLIAGLPGLALGTFGMDLLAWAWNRSRRPSNSLDRVLATDEEKRLIREGQPGQKARPPRG